MADKKKVIIYVGLSVIALTGGFLIYKYFQKGNEGKVTPVPEPLPKPPNEIESGLFPLRQGSYDNNYVMMLQDALGVTADGDFGPITYNALKSRTGKVQISNYDDLIATINSLKTIVITYSETNKNLSEKLIQQYKASPFSLSNIVIKSDTVAYELAPVALSNDFERTNRYVLNLKAGNKLPLSNYQLFRVGSSGSLIVYCKAGNNMGYWLFNPQDIELK